MRAALLIAGYLRTFKVNLPTIKKKIIEKFDIVDIYIHVTKGEARDDRYLNPIDLDEAVHFIHSELHPLALLHEDNAKQFDDRALNTIYNIWSKYFMLNGIRLATEHVGNFKYDIVIKYRPDLDILSEEVFIGDLSKEVLAKINSGNRRK